jgi:hypothetical protein
MPYGAIKRLRQCLDELVKAKPNSKFNAILPATSASQTGTWPVRDKVSPGQSRRQSF